MQKKVDKNIVIRNNQINLNIITFGLGCFWGAQKWFDLIDGVISTSVGYANSDLPNPTYEQVCNHESNGVEAVRVKYDSTIISTQKLINKFLEVVDPYSLNKQGNDIGTQYRSGIYFNNDEQKKIAQKMLDDLQNQNSKKIVIELKSLINYYLAEKYHQKYLEKNPGGYCHIKFDVKVK